MDEKLVERLEKLSVAVLRVDPVVEDDREGEVCWFCKERRYWVPYTYFDEDAGEEVESEYEGEWDIDHLASCPVTQAEIVESLLGQLRQGLTQASLTDSLEACLE